MPISETAYRQYSVLVDNKNTQHAEPDWLAIQTAQKHIYLHTFKCMIMTAL